MHRRASSHKLQPNSTLVFGGRVTGVEIGMPCLFPSCWSLLGRECGSRRCFGPNRAVRGSSWPCPSCLDLGLSKLLPGADHRLRWRPRPSSGAWPLGPSSEVPRRRLRKSKYYESGAGMPGSASVRPSSHPLLRFSLHLFPACGVEDRGSPAKELRLVDRGRIVGARRRHGGSLLCPGILDQTFELRSTS